MERRHRNMEHSRSSSHERKRYYSDDSKSKGYSSSSWKRRREVPSSDSYSEQPSCSSAEKQFDNYKRDLDSVFFKPRNSPIVYGTPEYESFWKFARKYEQRRKQEGGGREKELKKGSATNSLGIPLLHARSYSVNLKLHLGSTKELMGLLPPRELEERISEEMLLEFQRVLIYYLDFMQKEKFHKLRKLRDTQSTLPIAQYRDEIITSVTNHNVIIVAGDTGCGKSTQVPQYLLKNNFKGIGTLNGISPKHALYIVFRVFLFFNLNSRFCQLFQ